MASKLYNLARMTTATTGTGTITLGAAASGYLTFAQAGIANGDVIDYAIKDGNNSEIGTGTYTASGTTLTRTVTKSTNSNAAINLSGTAEVFITPRAETLADASQLTTGTLDIARLANSSVTQAKLLLGGSSNLGPTNLNTNLTTGFYAGTGYQNSPDGASATGNYWYVMVQAWDFSTHAQQFAIPLSHASQTNEVWTRTMVGGSWNAWQRLPKYTAGASDISATNTAKAWVNFNGTGTVAIRGSFNVSSITDNGVGNYTVNLSAAMASANYAIAMAGQNGSNGVNITSANIDGSTQTASSFRMQQTGTGGGAGGNTDAAYMEAVVFGS